MAVPRIVVALFGALGLTTGVAFQPSKTLRFALIFSDGDPLPALDVSNAQCTIAGHYSVNLVSRTWQSIDSSTTPACSSRSVRVTTDSGSLRIHGDTLAFYRRDARLGSLLRQRGVLRHDTLRAGALLFDGPPLLYVRVR